MKCFLHNFPHFSLNICHLQLLTLLLGDIKTGAMKVKMKDVLHLDVSAKLMTTKEAFN